MVDKVAQYVKSCNMMEMGDRIVIGLSGGADSVALFLMLQHLKKEYELELFAVHVNHGIREEAREDAEYARMLCESHRIPFYLFEANIPAMAKECGLSEEEMGRVYRYQCFENVMNQVDANKLAVAHHMDDQAETVLFHLVRGSRIAGMEGMHPVTELWNRQEECNPSGTELQEKNQTPKIIRPLLNCRKEELVHWLQDNNITWKEDCTNNDNTYARNCIRNQVIPALEQVNKRAVKHIAEFAEEMTAYKKFFRRVVDEYVARELVVPEKGVCATNRNHLLQQDGIVAKAVIYAMLTEACGRKKDIGSVHVQAVYDLLSNQSGRKLVLPYEMTAELSYEMLVIRKSLEGMKKFESFDLVIDIEQMLKDGAASRNFSLPDNARLSVHLYKKEQCSQQEWMTLVNEATNSKNNYTKFFECDTMKFALRVRNAKSEDAFVMNVKGDRKKVSRYVMDEKIPIEQRRHVLVLAEESDVLWIIGRRRCEDRKVTEQSKMILKVMYEGE